MIWVLVLSLLYRFKKLRHQRVIQLSNSEFWVRTQAIWLQCTFSYMPKYTVPLLGVHNLSRLLLYYKIS